MRQIAGSATVKSGRVKHSQHENPASGHIAWMLTNCMCLQTLLQSNRQHAYGWQPQDDVCNSVTYRWRHQSAAATRVSYMVPVRYDPHRPSIRHSRSLTPSNAPTTHIISTRLPLASDTGTTTLQAPAQIHLPGPIHTLTSPMESKPSSWFSSSSMVRWISRSPPLWASYRFVPMASISSSATRTEGQHVSQHATHMRLRMKQSEAAPSCTYGLQMAVVFVVHRYSLTPAYSHTPRQTHIHMHTLQLFSCMHSLPNQ